MEEVVAYFISHLVWYQLRITKDKEFLYCYLETYDFEELFNEVLNNYNHIPQKIGIRNRLLIKEMLDNNKILDLLLEKYDEFLNRKKIDIGKQFE